MITSIAQSGRCLLLAVASSLAVVAADPPHAAVLRVEAPSVLPRGQRLGEYSPLVSFSYSGLEARSYTLKVWLLEEGNWHCASSQWCERVFAIKGREAGGGDGSIQMTSPFDVFDYGPSLTWVARLFDSSGVEVAMAKARSKCLTAVPPELKPVGKRTGTVGNELRLSFSAAPVKGEKPVYRVRNAPSEAHLDSAGGVFTWTPTEPGLYRIVVEAVAVGSKVTDAEIVDLDIAQPESAVGSKS